MRVLDNLAYGGSNIRGAPVRTFLLLLAMAIGVASVVMLSSLGEAARQYVISQFSALGTHLLIVMPGRSETSGTAPPLLGTTPRDLTIADAMSLERSSSVKRIAPITMGSAPVSRYEREREVTVLGTTAEFLNVRELDMGQGSFLPAGDPERASAVAVLGAELKQELFGGSNALGEWVRINDRRYRVIGVLADKGQSLGIDMGDTIVIPVASAQALFNSTTLFRVLVQARSRELLEPAREDVIGIIRLRHDGEDDVTVITQDSILATFDRILKALTYTVVGIAGISLAVAGVLIMNVMLVTVSQRTSEVGLLKALGASRYQVLQLFLAEAALLSLIGAAAGMLIAIAGVWALDHAFPDFSFGTPLWSFASALGVAMLTGVVFGILPARRAADLDPVEALSGR